MEEGSMAESCPDVKDLEIKVGKKIPESLMRWMRDDTCSGECLSDISEWDDTILPNGLTDKLKQLKVEMGQLRSADVRILRQLLALNEGMETLRWLQGDHSALTSQTGSLTGSQSSLGEGPTVPPSLSPEPTLDDKSITSYLNTLLNNIEELCPPSSVSTPGSGSFQGVEVYDQASSKGSSTSTISTVGPDLSQEWPVKDSKVADELRRTTSRSSIKGQGHWTMLDQRDCPLVQPGEVKSTATGDCAEERLKVDQVKQDESEQCPHNSEAFLNYDTHWCWVESEDDVTFL